MEKLRSLSEDKKGSIFSVFLIITFVFGLAIFILTIAYIIPKVTEGLRESPLNSSSSARVALDEADDVADTVDSILLFLFVGLLIATLISSFMIDVHPIFIPIYIFLLGFAVVISVVLANAYTTIATTSVMNKTASGKLTYTNTILNHYVLMAIGTGILSMIVIFAKTAGFARGGKL